MSDACELDDQEISDFQSGITANLTHIWWKSRKRWVPIESAVVMLERCVLERIANNGPKLPSRRRVRP